MADLILDLSCPVCQQVFKAPFIVEDFIFHEISARAATIRTRSDIGWLLIIIGAKTQFYLCL